MAHLQVHDVHGGAPVRRIRGPGPRPPLAALVVDRDDGVRVATLEGTLDVFHAGAAARRVLTGLPAGARRVVLDLDGLAAADSGGVSALVRLQQALGRRNAGLHAVMGPATLLSPTLQAAFRYALCCHPSLGDATAPHPDTITGP